MHAPKPPVTTEKKSEHAIQKFELPNGLRLLVKEDHRLPFVEFRAMFQAACSPKPARTTASAS